MSDLVYVEFHFPYNKVTINYQTQEQAVHLAHLVLLGVPFSVVQGHDPSWSHTGTPDTYVINPNMVTHVVTKAQLPF